MKVRINPNGIFGVSSASLVEKHEVEEEVPVPMEVDTKPAAGIVVVRSLREENSVNENIAPAEALAAAEGEKPVDETMETSEKKDETEKKEVESNVDEKEEDGKKSEDAKKEEAPPVKMEKRKKIVNKTVDLPVTSIVLGSLSMDRLAEATVSSSSTLAFFDTFLMSFSAEHRESHGEAR